jgi:hypothetical protein
MNFARGDTTENRTAVPGKTSAAVACDDAPGPVWQVPQYLVAGAAYDIEVAVRTYRELARLPRGHDRTGNWGTLP